MDIFFSLFLRSVVVSGALYTYYLLALKDRKSNQLSRFYLLASFPVSMILPLLPLKWLQWQLPGKLADTVMPFTDDQHTSTLILFIAALCYFTVAAVLIVTIMWKIFTLHRLKQRSSRRILDGYCLVETDDPRAPFSFFNALFWKRGEDVASADNGRIVSHEAVHILQHHSYDRLFSQLCCGLFWLNPFFWPMQRELATIHEFLADEGAFEPGDTETFAKMILLAYEQGRYLAPGLAFSKSDIERRIAMIGRPKSRRPAWKKGAMITLFILILVTVEAGISYTRDMPASPERLKAIGEMEQKLKDERNSTRPSNLQHP